MQDQWHYTDVKSGTRVGPVGRDDIAGLIAEEKLHRATLVWNPSMSDWAGASSTELVSLFGNSPPPIPVSAHKNWAAYMLAVVPLLGNAIVAVLSLSLADKFELAPETLFASFYWVVLFIALNVIFGLIDERYLKTVGVKVAGATFLAALFVPFYLLARGKSLRRIYSSGHWKAYVFLYLWLFTFVLSLFSGPILFGNAAHY